MKVFLSEWMRELDNLTIHQIGIPSIVLMERASYGAAHFICEEYPLPDYENCLILVGKGNNGGDGLAVGRILHQKGYHVLFLMLFPVSQFQADSLINFRIIQKLQIPYSECTKISNLQKIIRTHSPKDTLIVDAVFGTGLNQPIQKGLVADAILLMNRSSFPIASLDVPSGISESFLPEESIHVNASITPTFGGMKWSLIHPDGNKACGKIRIIDIGIPREWSNQSKYFIYMIEPDHFSELLKSRSVDAHKGDFGHVLSIAGSVEKPGAGVLSAFAALKIGAGLVTAAIPLENRSIYIKAHPELMTLPYSSPEDLQEKIGEFDCLLAGPGLGVGKQSTQLLDMVLKQNRSPVILDADALNIIAKDLSLLKKKYKFPLVLTPHPGEFSRLTGLPSAQILRQRLMLSREFARQHGVYLILKGHHTIIATPEGNVYINQTGNAGMAKAGSGDVLSGMVAGLVAQFFKRFDMATVLQAAVFLHGYAADLAVSQKGDMTLMATDIIAAIPDSIRRIHDFHSTFQLA